MQVIPKKVFISYSHQDGLGDNVKLLADLLRKYGVDCFVDKYTPDDVWADWMSNGIYNADFICTVCGETYKEKFDINTQEKGSGVHAEAERIRDRIKKTHYDLKSIFTVFFGKIDEDRIPNELIRCDQYDCKEFDSLNSLYQRITGQMELAPMIGDVVPQLPEDVFDPIDQKLRKCLSSLFRSKDLKEFRDKILDYYPSEGNNFKAIIKADTFDKLFPLLWSERENGYLLCICEEYRDHEGCGDYFNNNYNSMSTDCAKMRETAKKSRKILSVILMIRDGEHGSLKGWTVDGLLHYDDHYSPMETLSDVDFGDKSHIEKLGTFMTGLFEGKVAKFPIKMQLILPRELFHIDLKHISFENKQGVFTFPNEFREVFNIHVRVSERIEHYDLEIVTVPWKTNWNDLKDKQDELLLYEQSADKSLVLKIDKDTNRDNMGANYNDGPFVSIVSDLRVNDKAHHKKILQFGLPVILAPANKDQLEIINRLSLDKKLVRELPAEIFNYIREMSEQDFLFIYDDYEDVGFLDLEPIKSNRQ